MKERIYKFLAPDFEVDDHFELRRIVLTKIFISITFIILTICALMNYFVFNDTQIAVLDTIGMTVAAYAIFFLGKADRVELAIKISNINLFVFFLAYAYMNQNSDFGFIWVMFFPIFLFPLNGHVHGLWISILFHLMLFSMSYYYIDVWQDGAWNLHSFIRLVFATVVLNYVVYINEHTVYRTHKELKFMKEKMDEYVHLIEGISRKDPLTNIYNRRAIVEHIENQIELAKRYGHPFCVMLFDIDYFKSVNDTYGHDMGDEVLQTMSAFLKKHLRGSDIIGRWGGEEFIVVMIESDIRLGYSKAEDLRERICNLGFTRPKLAISASIGVTEYKKGDSVNDLVKHADIAMYTAKSQGRNRVHVYNGIPS